MSSGRTAYADALGWLYGHEARGVRFGKGRIEAALAHRGSPQTGPRFVHVAGSNGKGSVCAMVERSLRAAGYRTGMFSSPHLHRWVERIRIAGRPLAEAEAVRVLGSLADDPELPWMTFFELTVLAAFESFRRAKCDVVVLEVGLGGRLDATNVIAPDVTVVTSIALEHRRILGDTHAAIAREKAGIFRPGATAVIGAREASARRALVRRAGRIGAQALVLDRDFSLEGAGRRLTLRGPGRTLEGVRLGLAGAHQRDNAACAFAALDALDARGLSVPDEAIRDGLRLARWPGRLERRPGRPAFLFDCAHNPDGCEVLARHLEGLPRRGRRVLLFGAMADKDLPAMLGALDGCFDRHVYASPSVRRAAPPQTFADIRPGSCARSVREGLARARRAAGEDGLVVVAGSIFLVSEVRALVTGARSDPQITM